MSPKNKKIWELQGSNLWHPACKAGALPAELNSHMFQHYLFDLFIIQQRCQFVNKISLFYWNDKLISVKMKKDNQIMIVFFNDSGGARTHDLRRDRPAL